MTDSIPALPHDAALAVLDLELEHEAVPASDVVSGAPTTAAAELLAKDGGTRIGVWEITPGTVTDTEADEVFVVLAGRGRVEFLGEGEQPAPLELEPGTVGRLSAGARTRWTITETLRKIYIL